ncbi:glycoside hydrolase family 43 protein [Opitutales bacterium ASA1]|uniref:glycoside hydrolase family 43 protein n=1 Tax=Congregicoccus parvus TaxID=3081749 RepID=UPI002B283815|nr:glycoside hydrolase family 43 protein [Opitutales bacterium ASA1]
MHKTLCLLGCLTAPLFFVSASNASSAPAPVGFDWFEYSGRNPIAFPEPAPGEFRNPILTGFYPDPSICRVGDDYYLTNSTFAYFPGLPVFHSKDLVNWKLIGHAIDRPDQLRYEGLRVSEGIFAPAITHHEGLFYMICTMVGSNGNFVLTAKDPAGPWSDPYPLRFAGIDPSIFFDDDGRAWIVNNDAPDGEPLYDGHRAIRIQEFDHKEMKVLGPRPVLVNGGVDISTKPIWIEGPHIYKRDGWYYLSCAEGGTGPGHSQVVFRSRVVTGPYVPWEGNPILTQRDLDPLFPGAVTCVGHADLEMGPDGRWWATFLGVRPYDGHASPMGRETFLLPVEWTEDGWPTILPDPAARIPLRAPAPDAVAHVTDPELPLSGAFTWRDEFTSERLSPAWIMLRAPKETWWRSDHAAGRLWIEPRAATLSGRSNPSYLGRRVQHAHFSAAVQMQTPGAAGVSAGLVAFQNNTHHYYLGVQRSSDGVSLFLERVAGPQAQSERVAVVSLPAVSEIGLRVVGDLDRCFFEYAVEPGRWVVVADGLDARMLTTAVAQGFVGATVGVHARLEP